MTSPKFILSAIIMLCSVASFSQADTTKKDTSTHKTDTVNKKNPAIAEQTYGGQGQQAKESMNSAATDATTGTATGNAATNTTTASPTTEATAAKDAIVSAPKPNFGRYYIPVLGNYTATATTTDNKAITITGDETNPGKVWIEGLTLTKFYALLKSVPGTYKIPAQKQDDNSIAEGTVVYDENSKQINLCLGCGFNDQAPNVTDASATTEPVAKVKKNKTVQKVTPIISFTGTKSDNSTVSILQ